MKSGGLATLVNSADALLLATTISVYFVNSYHVRLPVAVISLSLG